MSIKTAMCRRHKTRRQRPQGVISYTYHRHTQRSPKKKRKEAKTKLNNGTNATDVTSELGIIKM